jgi:DNA invertase Pin-like site-specific DNA recombinase
VRAFLYARVSTGENELGANGDPNAVKQTPEPQIDDMRSFCEHRGWTVADYFIDRISSAKRRPELERMLKLARAGKCDVILCRHYDRIARSTRELVTLLEEFRILNIHFISLNQQLDTTTPAGKLMFVLIAGFAEFERDMIRERVKIGMQAAKKRVEAGLLTYRGKASWGGRPQLPVDIEGVKKLRSEGLSLRAIAKEMNISEGLVRIILKAAPGVRNKAAENDHPNSAI